MSVIPDVPAAPSPAAPDVSGDSSTPSPDVFADQDFSSTFGLDEPPPDATEVTDPPPVSHPDEPEVVKPGDVETPVEEKPAEQPDAEKKFAFNEKLNWDDDKQPFREEFKELKAEYLRVLENSVEAQYLGSPVEFAKWMKETSPTSFNEVGGILATESANSHPQQWIEYLAKDNADLMAKTLTGRDITAERLNAELEVMLNDDDPDVQAAMEKSKAEASREVIAETPEQKEIREWREERAREAHAKVVDEVFQPIEGAVNSLVSQAGMEINRADYQGKNLFDLDETTQMKVLVNDVLIPNAIEFVVQNDPKLRSMQARLEGFLEKKDLTSAKALQHQAQIVATNVTGLVLELITGARANIKRSETTSPAKDAPRPIVKSAGTAVPSDDLTRPLTEEDWRM